MVVTERKLTKDGDAVVRVIEAISYWITTGRLAAGEQLRQEEMAEGLEISRAPIREALRTLADQGLLEHRVHSGYFVKKWPASELRQIYQMLEFLETMVMAELRPAELDDIAALRTVNDEMKGYVSSDDWAPMIDLNRRFHFTVFRLSPLNIVLDELERLWTIAAPHIARKYALEEMRRQTVEEHDGLIEAVELGDFTLLSERHARHRSGRLPGS